MSQTNADVHDSDPREAAKLMAEGAAIERTWRPDELGAVLRHQLSVPLDFDLGAEERWEKARLEALLASLCPAIETFADLLRHPSPPVELLEMTKQFARRHRKDPNSPLPKEIATVIYFASIVTALLRCARRITNLTAEKLADGLRWAMANSWIDDHTRSLFHEGLRALQSAGEATHGSGPRSS